MWLFIKKELFNFTKVHYDKTRKNNNDDLPDPPFTLL